jgi:hypothetical protein
MGGACSEYGVKTGVYRVSVGISEDKGPLGRPRHGLEVNIEMDPQEVGCGGMVWIELVQHRER